MRKQMSAVQWLLAKLRFATSFAASAVVNFGGIGALLGERAVFAAPGVDVLMLDAAVAVARRHGQR